MDWTLDGPGADYMNFDMEGGDLWDFESPLDFEQADLHSFDGSELGEQSMHIDPALVSPHSDAEDDLFAMPGDRKLNERRRPQHTNLFMPKFSAELSGGSRMIFGQVTPPSSTSSSPHTAPLDTVDPAAMMPVVELTAEAEPAAPKSTKTASSSSNPPTTSASSTQPLTSTTTSTSQTTAAAEGPPIKPKSKRGRKKKILAPAARDAQRARTLARNRAAAQRCRQRKKVEHAALEARARGLARERAALHTLVGGLRDELLSLKGHMLRHAGCVDADGGVAAYVQQQREMLMRGMPEDEALTAGPALTEDHEFLRELGIDPADPMGEGDDAADEDDEEDADEDEDEDESAQGDNDDEDAEAEAGSDAKNERPTAASPSSKAAKPASRKAERASISAQDTSETGISKRLRAQPRRTAKAKGRGRA